uniref:Uncharacterized protein n=1 Tax=Anguilla anguilla TaxID=7936 RepID=A0A0E9R168_ANGAN
MEQLKRTLGNFPLKGIFP